MKLLVLWHSLVVESYRRFFVKLAELLPAEVAMISPREGSELGFQRITCEVSDQQTTQSAQLYPVKTWRFHTQIIIYRTLAKIFKLYRGGQEQAPPVVFCAAEPYALTALYVWFRSWLSFKRFRFLLLACQNFDKPYPFFLRWIRVMMYRQADAIAAIGPHQRDLLIQTGYRGKIIDFPLWFESSRFCYLGQAAARDRLAEDYPFDKNKVLVGFIGPFNQQKGLLDLLDAVLQESSRFGDKLQLFLVGKGDLQDQVDVRSGKLQALGIEVISPGHLPMQMLPFFYASLDVLVMPSRSQSHIIEQFGRVIIEAEACGSLAIGSDCGHIPFLLEGQERVFVEGDLNSLANTLVEAIADSQAQGESERHKRSERAFAAYSDTHLAERFADALRELA